MSDWIKATQQSLGAHVKKPPLTEKLLSKPPFRFLFDVILAVISSTKFMQGLYSDAELNPEKDKDAKIAFLQKSIDVVQFVTQEQLQIKPSKTVAGQEPEKTNEFLQALAKAISLHKNGTDTASAVQRVLQGEKPDVRNSDGSAGSSNKENREATATKTKKPSSEKREKSKEKSSTKTEKEPSPSSENKSKKTSEESKSKKTPEESKSKKTPEESKSKTTSDESKSKKRDKSKDSVNGEKKKSKSSDDKEKRSKSKEKSASQEASKVDNEKASEKSKDKEKNKKSSSKDRDSSKEKKKKKKDPQSDIIPNGSIEHNDEYENRKMIPNGDIHQPDLVKSTILQEPSSSIAAELSEDRDETMVQLKRPPSGIVRTVRPTTAAAMRPGTALGGRPGTAIGGRPGTALGARPGTAAARPAPPKMKVRTEMLPEVEKPVEQVDGGKLAPNVISEKPVSASSKRGDAQDDEESAFIVQESGQDEFQRILAGKDDDDRINDDLDETGESHGALVNKILETKKELESGLQEFAKGDSGKTLVVLDATEREKIRAESKRLQTFIQQLTRNSHPLGKMMDYLQEDIDAMIKELNVWRQEFKENSAKLRQSGAISGVDLESMRSKLTDLDQEINDEHEALATIKASIIQNRDRAEQLMTRLIKK